MDCAGLPRPDVLRLGKRVRLIRDLRANPVTVPHKHVQLVLRFDRHVDPGLSRVKIEVPRAERFPAVGRNGYFVREHTVLIGEDFQRPRVFRSSGGAFVPTRHQNRQGIVGVTRT